MSSQNPETDYLELLNVPRGSSHQQIRAAYRALVKKWHPDKHPPPSRPAAEAMFKAISQAYQALSDQENGCKATSERSPWDAESGHRWSATGIGSRCLRRSQEVQPALSRSSNSGTYKPRAAVERKVECTLEELCRGCKKEVRFTREVIADSGIMVRKEESHTIRVQPGWKKGTRITFEGDGGGDDPDAVFLISEKEHPMYKRVGNELVLKVVVPLMNALTGWCFSFRLITGAKMSCSIRNQIIYPGYEKIIKGQGMPNASDGGRTRGDLRIKFHIVFPTHLSKERQLSIKELLEDSC